MAPATGAPSRSTPTLAAKRGKRFTKLVVPSTGSMAQRYPAADAAASSCSSPRMAWPGKRAASRSRIMASTARSTSETGSVGAASPEGLPPSPL